MSNKGISHIIKLEDESLLETIDLNLFLKNTSIFYYIDAEQDGLKKIKITKFRTEVFFSRIVIDFWILVH